MGESFSRNEHHTDTGIEIPIWKYDKRGECWQPLDDKSNNNKNTNILNSLTVVTYNVCFERDFYDQRCEQIFKIIQGNNVDVICLQEVTPLFVDKLLKENWAQDCYYLSTYQTDPSIEPYGCIILSIIQPRSFKRWALPSQMGRDCLVAEYIINGEEFACCTTHLESLDHPETRKEQLQRISEILTFPNAILMGDFNFDSTQNYSHVQLKRDAHRRGIPFDTLENMVFDPMETLENDILRIIFTEFRDGWSESGLKLPDEKGYTFDSVENRMIKQYERMRYDRILFKSINCTWDAFGINLIGTEPLDPSKVGGAEVYPSDHFGVIMTVRRMSKNVWSGL